RESGGGGEGDDLRGAACEREHAEDGEAGDVCSDHHPSAREAVDEGPDGQAEHDHRQEVGDQERGDPGSGVGAIPDVDGQRDKREPCAEPRAERRQEEEPEAGDVTEQIGLPAEQTFHDSENTPSTLARWLVEPQGGADIFGYNVTTELHST